MSICYADALSPNPDKGEVGMPEHFDSADEVNLKAEKLASWIKKSSCCVIITGAGISTSAGIADFRGPNGVWTLEKQEKKAVCVDFTHARPTLTHHALRLMEKEGLIKYVISQNVDGLHPISGFPMNRLAELHGNVFCEECDNCKRKYYREFTVGTIALKPTGRMCEGKPNGRPCRGKLVDTVLDWVSKLPEDLMEKSNLYSSETDLMICLGTSLQIVPVGDMPLECKEKRRGKPVGKIVTVNLQHTKHEDRADLAIHAKVDEVMLKVLAHLNIEIPPLDEIPFGVAEIKHTSTHPLEEFKIPRGRQRSPNDADTDDDFDMV